MAHAILLSDMKIALGIAAIVILALSLYADYKWKRWMAARKREREK